MTLSNSPTHRSPGQLRAMVYENQRTWVRRIGAVVASGAARPVYESGGVLAVRTGTTGAMVLPDPPDAATSALPGALDWLRHAGSHDVLIWAAAPHRQADRWLAAHGAREHFTPRWMIRSLAQPLPDIPTPRIATVRPARPDDLPLLLTATDIPYFSAWQARATLRLASAPDTRSDVALVVALVEDEIVGRAVMSIDATTGATTAGIYDVGVAPRWQLRGIARQLMYALLGIARDQGIDDATLNATPAGEPMYRAMGFQDAGLGQTWLLPTATVRRPPDEDLVRFAMLVSGNGDDLELMGYLARQHLPNGDTPLAHAARFEQPGAARQLVALGTIPDIAALWQLGLEDEARALMRDREALDARRGAQEATPLHIAIYWHDLELLEALLDAGADPHIRDGVFASDAWGWCHALGNVEALDLLDERFPNHESGFQHSR